MESFTSTTFFPKPKTDVNSMSKQEQCIRSELPVFAKDIGNDGKKTYFACGYEHFCYNMYKNKNTKGNRHVYELLQMEKPTKVYIDFDCSDTTKRDDFEERIIEFCNKLKEVIGDQDVPMYSLDATTTSKLSRHIIFELFLANVPSVQELVEHTLSLCPCEYLDRGVYTRNRVFRILYSYKFNKDMTSALRINGTSVDDEYNPEHVFRTLIQAMLPPHYITSPFSNFEGIARTVKQLTLVNSSSKNYGSGYSMSNCNIPPHFNDVIASFGGVTLSIRESDHFISAIVGGKKCPWNDTVHKNNNQYFTLCKSNLKGVFQCADTECGNVPYEQIDMAPIWRKCFV